jgi:type IV pilus assembly protein PilQ
MLTRFAALMLAVVVASPAVATPSKPQKVGAQPSSATPKFTGEPVSMTAKDFDLLQFLNALAEVSKRIIIADEGVGGKVTVRFRNVPWDEALDIVLRMKGLARQDVGLVIRVATLKMLADEEEQALRCRLPDDRPCRDEPLKVRLIPVNYTTADTLAPQVRDLLTPDRGTLTIDARTNTLIVKDTQEVLTKARLLVRNLDVSPPQVSIEARFVEATPSTIRSLGIQWCEGTKGTSSTIEPNSGATGPCIGGIEETATMSLGSFSPLTLPTEARRHLFFGTVTEGSTINDRIAAAEQRGSLRVLSSRKGVVLSDTAMRFAGEPLPQFAGVSPARSDVFIEYRYAIKATPHVTSGGAIQLRIETHSSREVAPSTADSPSSILRREAATNRLLRDGDTIVVGRFFEQRDEIEKADAAESVQRFVFLTPRIINRPPRPPSQADITGLESRQ